jgi:hypothetical protein
MRFYVKICKQDNQYFVLQPVLRSTTGTSFYNQYFVLQPVLRSTTGTSFYKIDCLFLQIYNSIYREQSNDLSTEPIHLQHW